MQHNVNGGRVADVISDVSLDEFAVSRETAVLDIVPDVVAAWQDKIMAGVGNSVTFTGCRWLDIDSLDGIGGFQGPVGSHPTVGAVGGAQSPMSVAFLVHKQCFHTRRQRNGRWYIPGVAESDTDDSGGVVSSARTRVQNITEDYRAAVNALGLPAGITVAMRVVHITSVDGDGDPESWNSTDIDSLSVDARVATQRRRLRK
jgi:hypothetical protein